MKITNSMSGKKEEFVPIRDKEVKMYACGITVYDLSHIGHARQAIVYAMITDYLRYRGYNVTYVRNYTDVDDKIIKKANELGKNAIDFSAKKIQDRLGAKVNVSYSNKFKGKIEINFADYKEMNRLLDLLNK